MYKPSVPKHVMVRSALLFARSRIRNQFRIERVQGHALGSNIRRIDQLYAMTGRNKDHALTYILFPYSPNPELKRLLQRPGFRTIFEIVDREIDEIEKEFDRVGAEMPLTFRTFYEVYKELLAERPIAA